MHFHESIIILHMQIEIFLNINKFIKMYREHAQFPTKLFRNILA